MASDDFEARTTAFLSWLSKIGVSMSPKMELRDLRSEGRGRGASKFLPLKFSCLASGLIFLSHHSCPYFPLDFAKTHVDLTTYSCNCRLRRGRNNIQHPTDGSDERQNYLQ